MQLFGDRRSILQTPIKRNAEPTNATDLLEIKVFHLKPGNEIPISVQIGGPVICEVELTNS